MHYWPQMAYEYHKSTEVFYCPSAMRYTTSAGVNPADKGHYGANRRIMPSNGNSIGIGGYNTANQGFPIAAFVAPSNTYMVMDWGYYVADNGEATTGIRLTQYMPGVGQVPGGTCSAGIGTSIANSPKESYQQDCVSGRHLGGINIAFADGHVKWLKGTTVSLQGKAFSKTNHSIPNGFDPLAVAG
jgi:prepilin-type processing-associated H-X9-DG protein